MIAKEVLVRVPSSLLISDASATDTPVLSGGDTKHVIIGVSDRVYERLLLLAQADGKSLTDWVRDKLQIPLYEREDSEEFHKTVVHVEHQRSKWDRDEDLKKHPWQRYRVKSWKNGNHVLVSFRAFTYSEFDAVLHDEPEKAGQYLLVIQKRDNRGKTLHEERRFTRSLKLYKRVVNRALGWSHFKVKGKEVGPSSAPAPSAAAPATTIPGAPSSGTASAP